MKIKVQQLFNIYRIVYRLSLEDGVYVLEYNTRFKRRFENKLKQIEESDNRDLLTSGIYTSWEIPQCVYTIVSSPLNDDGLPF